MSNCRRKLRVLPQPNDYVSLRLRQETEQDERVNNDNNNVEDNTNTVEQQKAAATLARNTETSTAVDANYYNSGSSSNRMHLTETKSLELSSAKHDDDENDDISRLVSV